MTSTDRLYHTQIAAVHLYAPMDSNGTWNLRLWPLVLRVFGMRYAEAGIAVIPCTIRYIMKFMMALEYVRRSSQLLQHDGCSEWFVAAE